MIKTKSGFYVGFEALDFIFPLAATLAATPVNPNSFARIRIFEDYDGGLEFN